MKPTIHIIGAGLAGSEAASYLARLGYSIVLHEMRPIKTTEAHHSENCAELVCSNSFKSQNPVSGPGMLKAEMRALGSMILELADIAQVPAGDALAVDREVFSKAVTEKLLSYPNLKFIRGEVTEPLAEKPNNPNGNDLTLIATGPLTSPALSQWLAKTTDTTDLYFYDAIAPIVDASSVDPELSFVANRYDKGEEQAYLNCPMDEAEYNTFIDALMAAEKVPPKNFEKEILFQGCQPIESIAATGRETLRFGPMKPVGLNDPKTGKRFHAVVQLRPENKAKTAYNLVGFQTKLKYGEQSKVFRLIPALKNAEFLRMGSIHRNTYVCGPRVLNTDLSLKKSPKVFLAGQITGVEGYLESAACGLLAALSIASRIEGRRFEAPPVNTALGALLSHVIAGDADHYQPSNIHFGLFDPSTFTMEGDQSPEKIPGKFKKLKKESLRKLMSEQTILNFQSWLKTENPPQPGKSLS